MIRRLKNGDKLEGKKLKKYRSDQKKKRMRYNETRRLSNRAKKTAVKTQIKKFYELSESADKVQLTHKRDLVFSLLDRCLKSNILSDQKVARVKSKSSIDLNNAISK